MITTRYTFTGYKGQVKRRFTCPSCGKENRVRTFTVEHTVNPFNKNEQGHIRTPSEVRARAQEAAREEAARFDKAPLCATCEGDLTYAHRKELREKRWTP